MSKRAIVVAEPVSNGRFYVDEIVKRGYLPVLVYSKLGEDIPEAYQLMRAHAKEYTDEYNPVYLEEGDDFDALAGQLRAYDIAAVVAGADHGVHLADRLSGLLGLPGNVYDGREIRTDKFTMQQALADAGVRAIQSYMAQSVDEVMAAAKKIDSWPIVIKPTEGAGTWGMSFCQNETELRARAQEVFTEQGLFGGLITTLVVQEYIHGTEYIVNTVSRAGRHVLTDMWVYNFIDVDNANTAYDFIHLIKEVEPGHRQLVEYAYDVLTALGFEYGPCHMEVMLDKKGPVLMEVNARPMGGRFTAEVLDEALGHHLVDRSLTSYLDEEGFAALLSAPYRPRKHVMCKYFIAPESMAVNAVPALPLLRHLPTVREVNFGDVLQSHFVNKTVNLLTAPGSILMCHEDGEAIMHDYLLARRIEMQYFGMLLQTKSSFTPESSGKSHIDALNGFLAHMKLPREDTLILVDAYEDLQALRGLANARIVTWDEADAEMGAYGTVILHAGARVMDFAAYSLRLEKLIGRVRAGGHLVVTPWAMHATEYGDVGMEILVTAMGLRLEAPTHALKTVLFATREA